MKPVSLLTFARVVLASLLTCLASFASGQTWTDIVLRGISGTAYVASFNGITAVTTTDRAQAMRFSSHAAACEALFAAQRSSGQCVVTALTPGFDGVYGSGYYRWCTMTRQNAGAACPIGIATNSTEWQAESLTQQQTCPAAEDRGTLNMTVGWALKPFAPNQMGLSDMLPGWTAQPAGCSGTCAVVSVNTPRGCWSSVNPTSQGLYRVSCDFAVRTTGASCNPNVPDNSSPSSAPPTCAGGVGTVNGQPVCLNTVGNTVQMPNASYGNPRAGSSPTDSNAAREPSSGSGGGPDARGGPGVTGGFNGSVGTGADRRPGAGEPGGGTSGTSPPSTDMSGTNSRLDAIKGELEELTEESCGGPGQPACNTKIDETGTPNGDGADSASRASADAEAQKLTDGIAGVVSGTGAPNSSTGFFSSLSFPSNCTPFSVGNARWGTYTVNFCSFQPIVHDLMSMVWVFFTILGSLSMVFRTMNTSGA